MATKLADGLVRKGARLLYPVQANLIFAVLPAGLQAKLTEHALFYPGYENGGTRLAASWSTSEEAIDGLLGKLV